MRKGTILSHVAVFESPYCHKLLGITYTAMNVAPTFEDKISIINNVVEVFHLLGEPNPKVAVVRVVETVNQRMESTMHAATLSMMNKWQQITGCTIDGPLTLDNAVSKKAAQVNGNGGLVAYLGTNSAYDAEVAAFEGDEKARLVLQALAYQVAKEIGAKGTVLKGEAEIKAYK